MDSTGQQPTPSQEETFPPLSPVSELLSTSILPINILIVYESETVVDDEQHLHVLRKIAQFNFRFSSVINIDKKGIRRWKKVDVNVQDHLVFPTFPMGLSTAEYDQHFHDYLSKIAVEPFPEGRPLWQIHVIKYPTRHGSMAGVFKVHHAIGDGYSLLSLACHAFERADDPSIPLSLPRLSLRFKDVKNSYLGFISKCINTVLDIAITTLTATVIKDPPSAIRSMKPAVESEPMEVCSITVSLEQVKQIKSKVDATVNDVITGLIYYTIHLYMRKMGHVSNGARMTLKVMFNTRVLKGYKTIDEMLRGGIWGNYAGFLQIPILTSEDAEKVDPIDFITKAKENTDRMKKTMIAYFLFPILHAVKSITGLMGMAKFVRSGFMNTSITMTNVVGPSEKMALMGHPINNFYFLVMGIPQSLIFTTISYMGNIKLVATTEKNFIDSKLLVFCMNEAFESTLDAIGRLCPNSTELKNTFQ